MPRELNDGDFLSGIRRALATNDVVVTSPKTARPRISREEALTASYLDGKNVLFKADASHGVADIIGDIRDGSVICVNDVLRSALVCFLCGHKSFTDPVSFDNLLAVADIERGVQIEIGRFSGPYVDLRT